MKTRCVLITCAGSDSRVVIKYGVQVSVVYEQREDGGWMVSNWYDNSRTFRSILRGLGNGRFGRYELCTKQRWWCPWLSYTDVVEHGQDAWGCHYAVTLSWPDYLDRCGNQERVLREIFKDEVTLPSTSNLLILSKVVD